MNGFFKSVIPSLLSVLLLSACGAVPPVETASPTPAPVMESATPKPSPTPDGRALYAGLLEDCRAVLYADWYLPLTADDVAGMGLNPALLSLGDGRDSFGYCLRDLNGDGQEELMLGSQSGGVMQLFTERGGKAVCIYSSTESDRLSICRDGTLLQEGRSEDGGLYMLHYELHPNSTIGELGGLLYNERAQGGPMLAVDPVSGTGPLDKTAFYAAADAYTAQKDTLSYTLFRDTDENAAPLTKAAADSARLPAVDAAAAPYCYTHTSLYDALTGVRAADLLLPCGWDAALETNWEHLSSAAPGSAAVTLTSPDRLVSIRLLSRRAYCDLSVDGVKREEGEDKSLYLTLRGYLDAEGVQASVLESEGFGNIEALRALPIPDALWQTAREDAEAMREDYGAGGELLGSEGTAARNLYQSGERYVECLSVVTAVEIADKDGGDALYWDVPLSAMLIADSEALWLQNRGVFETVIANFGFTEEFARLNARFGAELPALLAGDGAKEPLTVLTENTGAWLRESAAGGSDTWPGHWRGVLPEGAASLTPEGGRVSADAGYARLLSDGGVVYLGPTDTAPGGWTPLSPAD